MKTEKDRKIARYIEALFTGDFEVQGEIVQSAEDDVALIRELWETNIAVGEDLVYVDHSNEVRILAESTMGAAVLTTPQEATFFEGETSVDVPPILVSDVAAVIHSEIVGGETRVPDREGALRATESLSQRKEPLPEDALSERGARLLLHKLGIKVGRWFEEIFHGTAFDLEMGRRENIRLAAARRTRVRQTRITEQNRPPHGE